MGQIWRVAAVLGLLATAGTVRAQSEALSPPVTVTSAALEAAKLDVLVYNDGDRLRGHLVERSVDSWVFASERFGVLRVPLADAHVVLATPEAAEAMARANAEAARLKGEEAENASFLAMITPAALGQQLLDYFGPWHGRFSLSTQLRSDTADTTNVMANTHMQRKWAKDDVQLNAQYDFIESNHVTTTDLLRGTRPGGTTFRTSCSRSTARRWNGTAPRSTWGCRTTTFCSSRKSAWA